MRLVAGAILVGTTLIARVINSSSSNNSSLPIAVWIFLYIGIALMLWELLLFYQESRKKD